MSAPSTQWDRTEGGGHPVHVTPVNDLHEHDIDSGAMCPCMPRERDGVVVHNSYDRREVGEVCRKALDALSDALTDHDHEWSQDLGDAFDHAFHLLNIHWPPK